MFEIKLAFLGTDLFIGAFEDRKIEVLLVADMVVQHALVGVGLGRNPVDPRAGQPLIGKLLLGSLKNAKPHPLGVELPFQNSFCLRQSSRSSWPSDVLSMLLRTCRAAALSIELDLFGKLLHTFPDH